MYCFILLHRRVPMEIKSRQTWQREVVVAGIWIKRERGKGSGGFQVEISADGGAGGPESAMCNRSCEFQLRT